MPNPSSRWGGWRWNRPKVEEASSLAANLPEPLKKQVVYRDAVTGKFVTKEYAEANPKTTVKETI